MGAMPLGQRQVVDVMAEISGHVVEPIFNQTLASAVGPGNNLTITLNSASPLPATTYLYAGALVVVGWHGSDAEVVEVIAVTGDDTFTGNLVNAHASGESVFSATFPTQETTDPVWTQSEVIDYIAQAQNEFLNKVPLIFEFFENQLINQGQIFQTVPDTAIEMERVALETNVVQFAMSTVTRLNGTVTAVLPSSVNSDNWTTGLPVIVSGVANNTFNSASNTPFPLSSVSPDGLTLTWAQSGSNTASTGGFVGRPVWTRLYESNQNQIAMQNPAWQGQNGVPTNWFEDRSGIYGWGIAPVPVTNFYCELLCSVRASENLNLLSYFAVPDIFVPYVKYKTLQYLWSKDGIQRSPSLSRWAGSRFDFGVMLADRFLRNMVQGGGGRG